MSCPFATMHLTHLGNSKGFMKWFLKRLVTTEAKGGNTLTLQFENHPTVTSLIVARIRHMVLRSKPDCKLVDFTEHVNLLSIAEMQLIFEVAVPYLVHDLVAFGVPEFAVLLWCEPKPVCMNLSSGGPCHAFESCCSACNRVNI